jgi:hypothetical protein
MVVEMILAIQTMEEWALVNPILAAVRLLVMVVDFSVQEVEDVQVLVLELVQVTVLDAEVVVLVLVWVLAQELVQENV